jgi:anhydro-N-acetylmuramic acid kinase
MIINEIANRFFGISYDKDGKAAARGSVNNELLTNLMSHSYIKALYPKTTGREMFGKDFIDPLIAKYESRISNEDFIATVTYFTAKSVAENVKPFIKDGKTELIVGGGGSFNPTLLKFLGECLNDDEYLNGAENADGVEVLTQEDLGFSSDAKEAVAMVVIGNQTLHKKPSNVPSATGAKKSVPLGSITY